MDTKNNIFRKKSIEHISTQEKIDDYIRVANPGVWIILLALICLLGGICAWGVFGKIDIMVDHGNGYVTETTSPSTFLVNEK